MSDLQWLRRVRPTPPAKDLTGDELPTFADDNEHVKGIPLYERGPFAVIDTVKDLEYVVVDTRTMRQARRPVPLDLNEAKRLADELAEAEGRYEV